MRPFEPTPCLGVAPLRVFCAEDNSLLAEVIAALLTRNGHAVAVAHDGRLAWEQLSSDVSRFDVIVTDHQMPGMCGLELTRRLRQANFAGRVVVYSSSLSPDERTGYELLQVSSIVAKSAVAQDLLDAVEGR